MPKDNVAKRKAQVLMKQAAELDRRVADTAAAQKTNLEELAAVHKANLDEMAAAQAARMAELAANQAASMAAMVAAQSERMNTLTAKTAEVQSIASEIVDLLGDDDTVTPPPPPPPPPKTRPDARTLFLNPFNKDSAHHTPLGAGVEYGIPPSTLNPMVANPTYTDGVRGSRGRLALVRTFRVGETQQGQKYLHLVKESDPQRRIEWQGRDQGGTGDGLPINVRMPNPSDDTPYSEQRGDNECLLYPRNGGSDDIADVFPQLDYGSATARTRRSYPLGGRDVRNRFNDPVTADADWGPGAIDWRHPGGFLRGHEVDMTGAVPIRHLLNATATRHSRAGAKPAQHVLGKGMAYPAWNTDLPMRAEDNLGDLPYGTIIAVRWQDRGLRETLGLSPLGKQLFDTFVYFGCCLCDGQGQVVDDAPVLQLRVDWKLARDSAKVRAVEAALSKILPHLWPVYTARRHNEDAPRHSDGLIYVGNGGPLGPGAVNTAWDA